MNSIWIFIGNYYPPSNSYIYLYGDMDAEEKLRWLDEEYLSKYDYLEVHSEIYLQQPFEKPVNVRKYYNISSSESEENNTYLSASWSIGTNLDRMPVYSF